jgi:hypothetical protein
LSSEAECFSFKPRFSGFEAECFSFKPQVSGFEAQGSSLKPEVFDFKAERSSSRPHSTGFGVFRELVNHIKTTNWVLEGAIATFPLMYHYRIIPFSGQRADVDRSRHKSYVEYWGNSANAGKYMLDRAIANHELVLFLEYIPHVLETWLPLNPNKLQQPLDDLRTTIDFLRTKGIIHFDAHFRNVLTDGEQTYLTDFGLVLDKSFALTSAEKSFFKENIFYDYG